MSAPDPRRGQIAAVLAKHRIHDTSPGEVTCWACLPDGWMDAGTYFRHVADTVLPILRAAVEQARAETAEQIAQAIEAASRSHGGQARPKSYQDLADLAREHGSAP